MILIASDKYKGTLTAREVCDTIAQTIGSERCLCCPMADGGEGTAEILASVYGMIRDDRGWYATPDKSIAAIDSSEHIGIDCIAARGLDILSADSFALGKALYQMQIEGYGKIYVGVGGTGTCDGGTGIMPFPLQPQRFFGLIDVEVPLLAPDGEPSALMFAPQKGATEADMPMLRDRLQRALSLTSNRSRFDGAGGGVGFALASVLGAECHQGAEIVCKAYGIDWSKIEMVITGEGSYDSQTSQGKAADYICAMARKYEIPCVVIAGRVSSQMHPPSGVRLISTTDYLPDLPLNHDTALRRLQIAARKMCI